MKRLFASKKSDTAGGGGVDMKGEIPLAPGLCNLYSPQMSDITHVRDMVDVLVEMEKITAQQAEQIRRQETTKAGGGVEGLLKKAGATDEDMLEARATLCGFEFRRITVDAVNRHAFDKLDAGYIRGNHIMPVDVVNDVLVAATSEPTNVFAIDDVKRQTRMPVQVVVCPESDILAVCEEFDDKTVGYNVDDIMNDMADVEVVKDVEEDLGDLERSAAESPVIKYVNYLLTNALREGASDIHIEPKEKHTKIRYRIDGVLFDTMQAPAKMHPAVVSRLKIMANLDISERRLPQDGKISAIMGGRGVDLRVSILPTSHGEKVVIRILDSRSIMIGLENSGMEPDVLKAFEDQIALPHGILLVTGPTGSGKSTTLYSALGQMDGETLNISTVEDPVEYNLEKCNQVQANERIGLTFAAALRSLLRQDPDIIMVGEIRDNETARIAVQAALTGHLVLSTLHTNDAPSSVSRLVNIGIEPYLIAASLNGILAQRLVRRICDNCKEPFKVPENMRKYVQHAGIAPKELVHGAGCDQCRGSGYAGRAGIFELLIIDDEFRDIINKDTSVNSMRAAFARSGRAMLFDDGMKKVQRGVTTIEEVLRVTQVYGQNEDEAFDENVSAFQATVKPAAAGRGKTRAKSKENASGSRAARSTSARAACRSDAAAPDDAKSLILVLDEDAS
ncbi:MAG: Flp pilus assembly complex ATPase component TadA [Phycisphaerae bacterium]|nr:Flp pilus assembly complex ATPase component TadA [Phycisphaerae bacterium]